MLLEKPDHRPAPRHAAGVAALVLGALAFVVVAATQEPLWSTPDPRISVPAFVVTAAAAIVSIARRERAYPFWLGGLGLAGAALVLGWFLMFALIVAAAAVLILILHSVM